MPAQATNGSNPTGSSGLESSENCSFLFTSESVGEGHPGKRNKIRQIRKKSSKCCATSFESREELWKEHTGYLVAQWQTDVSTVSF